ncbi:MAG: sialidase family protein [Pseudohongiellaceae bacterium]|nr:sialidase family protein [Pseudohongiellaceae bacterium]
MTSKLKMLSAALAAFLLSSLVNADNCESVVGASANEVVSIHCGGAPSAFVADDGVVWTAFVQNQHVYVSQSQDMGKSFGEPLKVNAEPENIEFNGENRPKIIVSDSGVILLSWTTKTSSNFTGLIRFSRSINDGKTFSTPRTINDDGLHTGHRFDSLYLTESGNLYLTWIDKRDMVASEKLGEDYVGAGIYYTVSQDLGESFSPNYRVSHNSCECCRIAMAPHGRDEVAIVWRQIYDEHIRDHSFAILGVAGQVNAKARATVDDWHIDACPHHGPAMIEAAQGDGDEYHLAWFSNGNIHSGIHYGLYDARTETMRQIMKVDGTPGAGHPHMARVGDRIYMVWKGFDGQQTLLQLMSSDDEGETWSEPDTLYTTGRASDHPLLVSSEQGVYLSWLSDEYGYRFEEVIND